MKKILYLILGIATLSIIPLNMTKSSTISNEMFEYRMKMAHNMFDIKEIEDKIDYQYNQFYQTLYSNNNRASTFIDKLMCDAMNGEALPSVVIAQAAIETGYGRSNKLGNNIFGIKGRGYTVKTKEFINGRYHTIKASFKYFPTLEDAFAKHWSIIKKYNFQSRDYVEWAHKIKEGGYATDPLYAKKIIYVVDKYELYRLDKIQELQKELDLLEKNREELKLLYMDSV